MARQRKPRQYYPIWEKIKQHGSVLLSVPEALIPRLKKAIIKEKYMDERFKILNAANDLELVVVVDRAAGTIKFTLQQSRIAKAIGMDGKIRN